MSDKYIVVMKLDEIVKCQNVDIDLSNQESKIELKLKHFSLDFD